MSALADLTRRLDELAIELRQLAHRRLSAPRAGIGAIDQLIEARSREAERIAEEAERITRAEVAKLADAHSREFDRAALVALRELSVLGMLAELRGRREISPPRELRNPWSGDRLGLPARAPNALPLDLQRAHYAITAARNAVDAAAGPADLSNRASYRSPHKVA